MKYKGIIFDLDGVLCSTDRFHFEAWKQTAEEVGAPFDETINMKLRGVSRMESLEIILSGSSKTFTDAEKERLATEKNDRYRKLLAQMSPADMPAAVRDALTALHNAGLKLAVGSSRRIKSASERNALATASFCICPFESRVPSSVRSVSGVSNPCFRALQSNISNTSKSLMSGSDGSFPIRRYSLTVTG